MISLELFKAWQDGAELEWKGKERDEVTWQLLASSDACYLFQRNDIEWRVYREKRNWAGACKWLLDGRVVRTSRCAGRFYMSSDGLFWAGSGTGDLARVTKGMLNATDWEIAE